MEMWSYRICKRRKFVQGWGICPAVNAPHASRLLEQPVIKSLTFKTAMMCLQVGRIIIWARFLLKQIGNRKQAMQSSGTDFVQL